MTSQEAIKSILAEVQEDDVIVSSTGLISRELYNLADRDLNFYMQGSMGNALSIGLGIAINSPRRVHVINGDASALMSLGSMVSHKALNPGNLYHYILDNNCHASTGGQKTNSEYIDFSTMAPNTRVIRTTTSTEKPKRINLDCETIATRFQTAVNKKPILPKASILIPCFNKVELLKWGLYSLSKQDCKYKFEVIVLNDGWHDDTERLCKEYASKLNIKYLFTGHRNTKKNLIWRCPGFCLNIGVNSARSENIILTNAEIFHLDSKAIEKTIDKLDGNIKRLVKPVGLDDQKGKFLNHIKENKGEPSKDFNYGLVEPLNTEMPFFLGLTKSDFCCIGGYDEDLVGWAYDDSDFIARIKRYGCKFVDLDSTVVHLYHPRHNIKDPAIWEKYLINKNIYEEKDRQGVVYSNVNREWGILGKVIQYGVKQEVGVAVNGWHLGSIPKIAHFYWGNEQLPYLRYLSILSFKIHNPDWAIKVYTPEIKYKGKFMDTRAIPFNFTGRDYYPNLRSLDVQIQPVTFEFVDNICEGIDESTYHSRQEVYRSDFLRWHLLSTEGGLWSDMDIMYFKSMNCMNVNTAANKNANTIISLHPKYGHSVGFMLSHPKNKYYATILNRARANFNPKDYQSIGVNLLNKDFGTINDIENKFPGLWGKVLNIDIKTVYAYDALVIPTIYNYSDTGRYTENSIGLHWYAGHHLAKSFTNSITHLNYEEYNNVLSKTIQRVYEKKCL